MLLNAAVAQELNKFIAAMFRYVSCPKITSKRGGLGWRDESKPPNINHQRMKFTYIFGILSLEGENPVWGMCLEYF